MNATKASPGDHDGNRTQGKQKRRPSHAELERPGNARIGHRW